MEARGGRQGPRFPTLHLVPLRRGASLILEPRPGLEALVILLSRSPTVLGSQAFMATVIYVATGTQTQVSTLA